MSDTSTQIAAPVQKAATALTAGAGTSVIATAMENANSFLPTDLGGWMALAASTAACLYTTHLLAEFYWKKILKPCLLRRGWIGRAKQEQPA